jgi:hypothetical protein
MLFITLIMSRDVKRWKKAVTLWAAHNTQCHGSQSTQLQDAEATRGSKGSIKAISINLPKSKKCHKRFVHKMLQICEAF